MAGTKKSKKAGKSGVLAGARAAAARGAASHRDDSIESVAFVSLGCPKNLVDSEKMLGLLAEDGISPVPFDVAEQGEEVDAIVVNTCGFLEASKDESLQVIHDAIKRKQAGQIKRVVVAGCLVQRHRAKMLEWAPGIDAMVGVFDRDKIVEAVRGITQAKREARAKSAAEARDRPAYWIAANALVAAGERGMKTTGLTVNGKDGKGIGYFEDDSARMRLTPRHYAYLRISEGCNQNCAFCTIPSIRGKMRSKPLEKIAAEARELIADGAFELHLIGQDTTSYGDDIGQGLGAGGTSGRGLPEMLRVVSKAFDEVGVKDGWVRLMYAYPTNFSDACIEAIASTPRVLPYIDMPLQHASDRMLSAMRRNTTRKQTEALLEKLRRRVPGMTIRTTFISGFPGETEQDHKELLDFVREQNFEALGVFEYSHEPGTVAGTMEQDPKLAVSAADKARRRGEVMALQQELAFARQRKIAEEFDEKRPGTTGRRVDVLIDSTLRSHGKATSGVGAGGGLYQGRTSGQAPQIDSVTFVQSKAKLSAGELVRCTIVGADGYDLIAVPVDELEKKVSLKVMR
ncbi:MAG: 30S ribosomal protein S12 methylthiotransferase RimO [Planctomyces sp.]